MGRRPHLTPEEAAEVRDLYAGPGKWTTTSLAHCFRVNLTTIRAALNRSGAYRAKPPKPGDKK